jgi:hypothetical protein
MLYRVWALKYGASFSSRAFSNTKVTRFPADDAPHHFGLHPSLLDGMRQISQAVRRAPNVVSIPYSEKMSIPLMYKSASQQLLGLYRSQWPTTLALDREEAEASSEAEAMLVVTRTLKPRLSQIVHIL